MVKRYTMGAMVMTAGDPNLTGQAYIHATQTAEEAFELARLWAHAEQLKDSLLKAWDELHNMGAPDALLAEIRTVLVNATNESDPEPEIPRSDPTPADPQPQTHKEHLEERFRAEAAAELIAEAAEEEARDQDDE